MFYETRSIIRAHIDEKQASPMIVDFLSYCCAESNLSTSEDASSSYLAGDNGS